MASLPPGLDLSQVPLATNPSGAPSNFVNPPSLISAVRGVGITLNVISLILIVLRLTIYYRVKRSFGLDDGFVITAWVLASGYTGISCSLEKQTRHAWDTPLSFLDEVYLKKLFVTSMFYGPMLFFGKASILLLYYRTFHPKRWLRIGVLIILVVMFGSYVISIPLCITYCMPHNGHAWDFSVLLNCNHLSTPGFVQAAMNIAADLAIFVLPLPIIAKLQMPMGKKIAVAGIFATGLIALLASVLTVYYRVRIIKNADSSWAGAQTYILIQAEIYITISVACMPSLARIWRAGFEKSRIYRSIHSLWSIVKGMTYKSVKSSILVSESTTGLQRAGYHEIHPLGDARAQPNGQGILRTTTFEMSSMDNSHK